VKTVSESFLFAWYKKISLRGQILSTNTLEKQPSKYVSKRATQQAVSSTVKCWKKVMLAQEKNNQPSDILLYLITYSTVHRSFQPMWTIATFLQLALLQEPARRLGLRRRLRSTFFCSECAVFGASQYILRANFLFFFVRKCPTFAFFSEAVTGAVTQRLRESVSSGQ